jgi:hypothetical protein
MDACSAGRSRAQNINQLPARAIDELEKFFQATNALEAKTLRFLGWGLALNPEDVSQYLCNSEPRGDRENDCKEQAVMSNGRAAGENGEAGEPQHIR